MKNYPIIIYDSNCYFCIRILEILDIKSPVIFIGVTNITSIKYIVNKQRLSGAWAVINILAYNNNYLAKKIKPLYNKIPYFNLLCEYIYTFIANHRGFLSKFL